MSRRGDKKLVLGTVPIFGKRPRGAREEYAARVEAEEQRTEAEAARLKAEVNQPDARAARHLRHKKRLKDFLP